MVQVQGQAQRAPQAPAPAPQRSIGAPATPAGDLVTRYCVSCHNARVKTAGLSLDGVDATSVASAAETWEKVVVKLRSRSMPPAGIRRPDNAAYDATADWLERELDRSAQARPNPGRPADLHRLNRVEYANAVRDLLGLEIDPAAMLPADTQAHGFDNNADALAMEPALLDRYLTAAARIARTVVGDATVAPSVERYTAVKGNANEQTWLWQTERLGEDFPLGSRGGIAVRHFFPVDGDYELRVRLGRTYADVIRGLQVPSEIQVRLDGVRVGRFAIGGPEIKGESQDADEPLRVRVPVAAGAHQVVATIVQTSRVQGRGAGPGPDSDLEPGQRRALVPAVDLGAAHRRALQRNRAEGLAHPPARVRLPSGTRGRGARLRHDDSDRAGAARLSPGRGARRRRDAPGLL